MRRIAVLCATLLLAAAAVLLPRGPETDPRLKRGARGADRNGWLQIHLEGTPSEIGFQHGYLLAAEIQDNFRSLSTSLIHDEKKDWHYFRNVAREVFWPHVEQEYRQEIQGIVDGLKARSVKLDLWDVVAMNASLEYSYYNKWLDRSKQLKITGSTAEHCSAFVATGSYTADGRVVIGHNNWSGYSDGVRWNVIFDIVPAKGHRILMDGMPGLIHSGDDFGINSAGMLITETTISRFFGFDPAGVPEFVRARKAMQYSSSIDDFARIMKEGNNGGYANDWLVADRKTNEIASLELGLKVVTLERSKDGFFVGANFVINRKLGELEAPEYNFNDAGFSGNARRKRWEQLMAENKGKIDVAAGKRFLADHYDTFQNKEEPNERTLCGHIDLSPRGSQPWQPPFGTAGAVQSKVSDAAGAGKMTFQAALGHSCGIHFRAAEHLRQHPEFAWQKDILRDMPSRPWTEFAAK